LEEKEIKVIHPTDVEPVIGEVGWKVIPSVSRLYANSDRIWLAWVYFDPKGSHDWHTHKEHDEAFFVVSGEIDFYYKQNGQIVKETLKDGDAAFVPMGLEHKWQNGGKPLKGIVAKSPAPPGAGV